MVVTVEAVTASFVCQHDDTIDNLENSPLEPGYDPYADKIIGGKNTIKAVKPKYPQNKCKECNNMFKNRSKWVCCISCDEGTHKRCVRKGESLDNFRCPKWDPRWKQMVKRLLRR